VKAGILMPGSTIIEATSGNTGVGLAMVGAVKGYKILLVMPDSCSLERRRLFQAFGAECLLVPREIGAKGLIEATGKIAAENPSFWWSRQFANVSNPEIHIKTTAQEIISSFPHVDILVGGVGTGGHVTGCALALRPKYPNLKVYAVEPEEADVLGPCAAGTWKPHKIMGMGPDFRPDTFLPELTNGIIKVNSDRSWEMCRRSAREEGVFVGISSGSCLAAVERMFEEKQIPPGSTVLTFNYDSGERYLSIPGLFPNSEEKMIGLELLKEEEKGAFHERTLNKFFI